MLFKVYLSTQYKRNVHEWVDQIIVLLFVSIYPFKLTEWVISLDIRRLAWSLWKYEARFKSIHNVIFIFFFEFICLYLFLASHWSFQGLFLFYFFYIYLLIFPYIEIYCVIILLSIKKSRKKSTQQVQYLVKNLRIIIFHHLFKGICWFWNLIKNSPFQYYFPAIYFLLCGWFF